METFDTFFARITPWMPPSDIMGIQIAYSLSKGGHRHQIRKKELDTSGNPIRYFNHPRRVAIYLLDILGIRDPAMIIASLHHDNLEDSKRITEAMVEHLYGRDVVQLVKLLSKLRKEGYFERLYTFGNWRTWTIKVADRIDNLRSIGTLDKAFQVKQRKETLEFIVPLIPMIQKDPNAPDGIAEILNRDLMDALKALDD